MSQAPHAFTWLFIALGCMIASMISMLVPLIINYQEKGSVSHLTWILAGLGILCFGFYTHISTVHHNSRNIGTIIGLGGALLLGIFGLLLQNLPRTEHYQQEVITGFFVCMFLSLLYAAVSLFKWWQYGRSLTDQVAIERYRRNSRETRIWIAFLAFFTVFLSLATGYGTDVISSDVRFVGLILTSIVLAFLITCEADEFGFIMYMLLFFIWGLLILAGLFFRDYNATLVSALTFGIILNLSRTFYHQMHAKEQAFYAERRRGLNPNDI